MKRPSFSAFLFCVSLSLNVLLSRSHRVRLPNYGVDLSQQKYVSLPVQDYVYSPSSITDPTSIAEEFARKHLSAADLVIKNAYKSEHNEVTHVYLRQVVDGLDIINGDINVNVDNQGRIISYGTSGYGMPSSYPNSYQKNKICAHSCHMNFTTDNRIKDEGNANQFVVGSKRGRSRGPCHNQNPYNVNSHIRSYGHMPRLTPIDALQRFAQHINHEIVRPSKIITKTSFDSSPIYQLSNVPLALSDVIIKEAYIAVSAYVLEPVWDLTWEMEENWYHAQINMYSGRIHAVIDWVSDAMYTIYPLGINDPSEGDRTTVIDPHDIISSPGGWHTQGKVNYTSTIGNNVYAHENLAGNWEWKDNYRPEGGPDLVFDFPLDLKNRPKDYIDSSVTNLFYWNNMIHDLFYRYGFNEEAGNFQQTNYGKGGKDKDAVIANAQDGSGYNNANFATPPDGQHGKMRMYVWDVVKPWRDGDLESGIVIHEYSHGISTRLTGGPANSGCLGWGESGGMGEGWGDFFATILRVKPSMDRTVDFGMGDWANGGEGIRRFKYSTSKKTNPETFVWLEKPGYWGVHAKGAVWANMLYEVFWNLVDKHGFTMQWFSPTSTDSDDLLSWYTCSRSSTTRKYPKQGNTLMLQLVLDAMKLQPCRPSFINARDAILQADEVLTSGENYCEIWKAFAKRGLGTKAKVVGGTPWGGGERKESYQIPKKCRGDDYEYDYSED